MVYTDILPTVNDSTNVIVENLLCLFFHVIRRGQLNRRECKGK